MAPWQHVAVTFCVVAAATGLSVAEGSISIVFSLVGSTACASITQVRLLCCFLCFGLVRGGSAGALGVLFCAHHVVCCCSAPTLNRSRLVLSPLPRQRRQIIPCLLYVRVAPGPWTQPVKLLSIVCAAGIGCIGAANVIQTIMRA